MPDGRIERRNRATVDRSADGDNAFLGRHLSDDDEDSSSFRGEASHYWPRTIRLYALWREVRRARGGHLPEMPGVRDRARRLNIPRSRTPVSSERPTRGSEVSAGRSARWTIGTCRWLLTTHRWLKATYRSLIGTYRWLSGTYRWFSRPSLGQTDHRDALGVVSQWAGRRSLHTDRTLRVSTHRPATVPQRFGKSAARARPVVPPANAR